MCAHAGVGRKEARNCSLWKTSAVLKQRWKNAGLRHSSWFLNWRPTRSCKDCDNNSSVGWGGKCRGWNQRGGQRKRSQLFWLFWYWKYNKECWIFQCLGHSDYKKWSWSHSWQFYSNFCTEIKDYQGIGIFSSRFRQESAKSFGDLISAISERFTILN